MGRKAGGSERDAETDGLVAQVRRILVAVGNPEIEIMAGLKRASAHDTVEAGVAIGRAVDGLHAVADVLKAVLAPLPGVADHFMQAESVWRVATDRARSRLAAEAGVLGIEVVAPRENRAGPAAASG